MDMVEMAMLAGVAIGLIGLAAAVFWPMKTGDDVMQGVHGDQPRWPQ